MSGRNTFVEALGPGWRPKTPVYTRSVDYWSAASSAPLRVWIDSSIQGSFGTEGAAELYFHTVYITADPPPATLPGTPV